MAPRLKQRRGIGNVVTTLIILIASVAMGSTIVLFGGSMFKSNAQDEQIRVSNAHIWVAPNGTSSVAGFVVQNAGGKTVSVNSITVRGMEVQTGSMYYNTADASAANVQRELAKDFSLSSVDVSGSASEESFLHATGPITLTQGQAVIIYLANPGSITGLDINQVFTLHVQAGKGTTTLSGVPVVFT